MPSNAPSSAELANATLMRTSLFRSGKAIKVVYRRLGAGDGVVIDLLVHEVGSGGTALPRGLNSGSNQAQVRSFSVSVPAIYPGAAQVDGTGPDGILGVVRLAPTDTIEVEGVRVGRPDKASVLLTVGAKTRKYGESHWTGEVTL